MGNLTFHLLLCCTTTLYIYIQLIQFTSAAVERCNFEKYGSKGCFSQANFICDESTNMCICDPRSPVLIEQRLCLPKVRINGTCQYNEQCDIEKGFFCSFTDYEVLNNNSPPSGLHAGRFTGLSPKCRSIRAHQQHSRHRQHQEFSHQFRHNQNSSISSSTSSSTSSNSSTRITWILLGIFALLLSLLIFIKSQSHIRSTPFRQQEDQLSISSAGLDVPPPYEVAIRMKL